MWRGSRSNLMLAGLVSIAIANGLLLGLTLYGLAAALIGPVVGVVIGLLSANYILVVSFQRERALRRGEYEAWQPLPDEPQEHPLVGRLRSLTRLSDVPRTPELACLASSEKNAFTVGRSPEEASIVLTSGLIDSLTRPELDAVLAQQLAHIERDDVRAVGIADAIADSIQDLARIKGRFLWGPKEIFIDLRPVLLVTAGLIVVVELLPSVASENLLVELFVVGLLFWLFYALWQAVKLSWRGLAQLALFASFFGPLSLVEAALSPPTAVLLSLLVSRARVHEADERALQLTRDPRSLESALAHVADVEREGSSSWLGNRRYSLFVAPAPEPGWWPWFSRQRATHPSISSRLEQIRELSS